MTSDRAYRRALPHEVAMGEIERCSGTPFDPEVAHSFAVGLDDFREEQLGSGKKVRPWRRGGRLGRCRSCGPTETA